nr:MAG TPA: hypothetical protein [Caudoviricetes sp.]
MAHLRAGLRGVGRRGWNHCKPLVLHPKRSGPERKGSGDRKRHRHGRRICPL